MFVNNNKKVFNVSTNLIFIIIGAFLFLELLLPKDSPVLLFKNAYTSNLIYHEKSAPDSIEIDSGNINIQLNSRVTTNYTLKGEEGTFARGINYKIDDPTICTFSSISQNRCTVFGTKVGQTNLKVYSCVNPDIYKNIIVNVYNSTVEPLTYDNYAYGACLNGSLFYSSYVRTQIDTDIKFFLMPRDANKNELPCTNTYECDGPATIDSNGNMHFNSKCYGQTINVTIKNEYVSHSFSIGIKYPDNYKNTYVLKSVVTPLIYVFSFFIIGYCFSLGDEYIIAKSHAKKRYLYAFRAFSTIFPFVILFLHYFALGRSFAYIYWIIAPISFYFMYILDGMLLKLAKKVLGIKGEKQTTESTKSMDDKDE